MRSAPHDAAVGLKSQSPAIRAILPYFGGKRTLAPRIVAAFGRHRAYWEPFCGSLAVLMAKEPAGMECANDMWGVAINLARVLASERWEELHRRVERTLIHEDLAAEASSRLQVLAGVGADKLEAIEDPHVELAYYTLVSCWQGPNGTAGAVPGSTLNGCRRFTATGGTGETRWTNVGRSIPAWHARLKKVYFSRMDGIEMCERVADAPGNVIYADPPYFVKSKKYIFDFLNDDHLRLAEALGRFRHTRVVVSYYVDPRLDELYPRNRWTRIEMPVNQALSNQRKRGVRGAKKAPELLLINGGSLDAGANELWPE